MSCYHTSKTQREWLTEDFDQIRRYFPGAELLEAIETPFDIKSGGILDLCKTPRSTDENAPVKIIVAADVFTTHIDITFTDAPKQNLISFVLVPRSHEEVYVNTATSETWDKGGTGGFSWSICGCDVYT